MGESMVELSADNGRGDNVAETNGFNGQNENGHLNGENGHLLMPSVNQSYNQQNHIVNGNENRNILEINDILEHLNGDEEMGDVVGLETSKVQRKLNFN